MLKFLPLFSKILDKIFKKVPKSTECPKKVQIFFKKSTIRSPDLEHDQMRQLKFYLPRIVGAEIKKGTVIRNSRYDLIHAVQVDHHSIAIAYTEAFLAYEPEEWDE